MQSLPTVYTVTKSDYYGGLAEIIGVYDSKLKAQSAADKEMGKCKGWVKKIGDKWLNSDYEWEMTIDPHELQ